MKQIKYGIKQFWDDFGPLLVILLGIIFMAALLNFALSFPDENIQSFCEEKGHLFTSDYKYNWGKDIYSIECTDKNNNKVIYNNLSLIKYCIKYDKWGDCTKTKGVYE